MEENKNLNEKEQEADNAASKPFTIAQLSTGWDPYEEEEEKNTDEYKRFKEAVLEFDNENLIPFVYSRPDTLNALKSSLSFRARTSPNVSVLVDFEIQEIEIMFKQDFSSYYGLWWPIIKWAFEKVSAQRPLRMGDIRSMWLESEICLLIKGNAPINNLYTDYDFVGKYLEEYPYNVYWLECLNYIEEGGNYAFYLEYLKQYKTNTNIILEHTTPANKIVFKGSSRQLGHIIWQMLNTYKLIPGTKEEIAKSFTSILESKKGKKISWSAIYRIISNKDEKDVMPSRGMAHKRPYLDVPKEDNTEI